MDENVFSESATASAGGVGRIPGSTAPWIRRLDRDLDLLAVHRVNPQRYPFLLESVDHQRDLARYDILFAFPGKQLCLNGAQTLDGGDRPDESFLDALDGWFNAERTENSESELPFSGGWFLLLGYELASQIEPKVPVRSKPSGFPLALAVRCPAAIVRDRLAACCYLVAEPAAGDALEALQRDAAAAGLAGPIPRDAVACSVVEEPAQAFLDAVAAIKDYILAGDVFQVNLSRAWRAECRASPVQLYAALREHNPAPFAGLALWQGRAVISSSPERLVQVRDGWAQTRPIAGTRSRDLDRFQDRERIAELINNPKERAEHLMLIDMERNDLGRVCLPGTLAVNELMTVESYTHVHHIVSNVRGRLRAEVTPGQVIKAVFPGGTITGCPKVRCMQIIAELEFEARGPYTGSMGYLNRDGSMDLNILIRSMLVDENRILLRAGAGIVADSVPELELEETRSKALGLLRAIRGSEHE